MSRWRKHMTASLLQEVELPSAGQQIVRALAARGGNVVEVERPDGSSTLVLLPARFVKKLWVRKGGYLLIEACPEAEAAPGSKITGTVVAVLYADHIRQLSKVPGVWPPEFAAATKTPVSDVVLLPGSDLGGGLDELSLDEDNNPDVLSGLADLVDNENSAALPCGTVSSNGLSAAAGPGEHNSLQNQPAHASGQVAVMCTGAGKVDLAHQNQLLDEQGTAEGHASGSQGEDSSEEDDDLPPLHRNTNRKVIYHEVSSSEDDD